MTSAEIRKGLEQIGTGERPDRAAALPLVEALLAGLESGSIRAAEPDGDNWRVHAWVKQGILLAFRIGQDVATTIEPAFYFRDRDTLPPRDASGSSDGVRVVPGGTAVRRGAHLGKGVVVMPPSYVNAGAFVGAGSMVDSHALVGSCAQIGERVHLSAAAQIGGVLEPVGSLPVIVEDGAFVGGGCGLYEGCRIGKRAVLAAGVVLARGIPVYDLIHSTERRAGADGVLRIPDGAVVIPGSRPASGAFAQRRGLHVQTPLIVKYRDASTDAASALEEALR